VLQQKEETAMIAKPDRRRCSYYFEFISRDALAASPASTRPCGSKENRLLWTEALGTMMRSLSEFLMLATSRSPAQWMTSVLPTFQEKEGRPNASRDALALGDRPATSARARAGAKAKHRR
jgi:hypothetical protein